MSPNLPGWPRQAGLLPKASRQGRARGDRPCRRRRGRQDRVPSGYRGSGRPRRTGADGRARDPPLGFHSGKARDPRSGHLRSRPGRRPAVAAGDRGRTRDPRRIGRDWPAEFRQDNRWQRLTCGGTAPAQARLGRGQEFHKMGRRSDRRAIARSVYREPDQAGATRPHLHRLSAQQPRRHRDRRLFAAGAAGRSGIDAAVLARGREERAPGGLHGRHRAAAPRRARHGSVGRDRRASPVDQCCGAAADGGLITAVAAGNDLRYGFVKLSPADTAEQEVEMPRASWNGFLRLSLVTCLVYMVPATTEAKRVRFNQLNGETGNRVAQQLVDSKTGEVVDRDQIVKGYEYERGRYVTISDDELKDLQIESSKIIDLDRFVDR